jgi:peptidoglycan hydrolase-like protein with peptidoglycan-binding domain
MALRRGSRGDDVKALQKLLNDNGANLTVDGIFGPKTEAALRTYQKANGLASDGVYGPQTKSSLAGTSTGAASSGSGYDPDADRKDYTDDDDRTRFLGLPSKPEIWYDSVTKQRYVVFFVPNTEPPVPMLYKATEDDLKAYFGEGNKVVYDRVLTSDELKSTGGVQLGSTDEIRIKDGDPFGVIADQWEREAKVLPFLSDPEVAAIVMSAWIEDRAPSEAELKSTEYWQTHTQGERDWLLLSAGDPLTAKQALDAKRREVRQMLERAGVYQPDEDLVNYMADQRTMGHWTDALLTDNINKVADPEYYGGEYSDDFAVFLGSRDDPIDRNVDKERYVRETAAKWLGPAHGVLTDKEIADIAGRMRNDPNYEDIWIESLKDQRVAMYPGYEDRESTYDDIARPWRSVYTDVLGETADETSDQFQEMVRRNDLAVSRQQLRQHGLENNNTKVTNAAIGDLGEATGYGVRRVI